MVLSSHRVIYGGEAMKLAGAKKQTLFLTVINAVVRALGLLLRMILSRVLGAELMGIAELAQSVHMVAITPLTSGIPVAISRMTARASHERRIEPLSAGIRIVRIASLILIPALWFTSPWLARLMGDIRVLPSIWFSAPCILVLGYSAVYNGYCYGTEQSFYPAMSELIEQIARLVFSLVLIAFLRHLSAPWMASVPVAGTLAAEIIGLIYVISAVKAPVKGTYCNYDHAAEQILRLAAPATLSRLLQTLLRSVTAVMIPVRLQASGLPAAEATAQLGMLNGMVMPILMLPCVFTSALSMVSLPKVAKAEEKPGELRRILGLCVSALIPAGLVCAGAVYLLAPFLSNQLYRLAELTDLFRFCAPMTLLFALSHLTASILSALGQQKRSMYASSFVSFISLGLTWLWTGDPALRLRGVVLAQYAGQLLTIVLSVLLLFLWRRERHYVR